MVWRRTRIPVLTGVHLFGRRYEGEGDRGRSRGVSPPASSGTRFTGTPVKPQKWKAHLASRDHSSPRSRAEGYEQPSREFASAGPTTRAKDAGLQVARIGPALSQHACRRSQHFQPPTPPCFSPNASPISGRRSASVAESVRRGVNWRTPKLKSAHSNFAATAPYGSLKRKSRAVFDRQAELST